MKLSVDPAGLWTTIENLDAYRGWWPWLQVFDATSLVKGETWVCVVQPPLRYSVRFTVRLEEVIPTRLIAATIAGDIVGSACLDVRPDGDGCEARLRSSLVPHGQLLRVLARVAPPVVRYGHDWVLRTGLEQFSAHIS